MTRNGFSKLYVSVFIFVIIAILAVFWFQNQTILDHSVRGINAATKSVCVIKLQIKCRMLDKLLLELIFFYVFGY